MSQMRLFEQERARIARLNLAFLDLVQDGLTREELTRNIERRPEVWERFAGFLGTLPSGNAPSPTSA